MQTGFGKAREAGPRGIYKVVIRTRNETVSRAALQAARDLVMAAIEDRPYPVNQVVADLTQMVDRLCIGPSTACIVDAAAERNIPAIRLNDGNLVQLGYGANQRRIWTAETDQTSAIAEGVSKDKDLTKSLLANCGVPVPEGRTVSSPQEAWEAALDIGLPVCVKPVDGNHARGVSLELRTQAEIEAAYHLAEAEGSDVLVERHILGDEHRLLVVGGKVVAANKGETASIVGDGIHTVEELIEIQINSDPRGIFDKNLSNSPPASSDNTVG
jgi:cyanophycin synthetase